VEIREVDPAPKVKQAMEEQTSSERLRRAAILRADGEKRAAILSAEGSKRARILQAEGIRQSKIVEAEGERLATILQSQGEAQKLRILSLGSAPLDSKALTVLSMQTMQSLGESASTKWIIPFEVTKVLEGMSEYMGVSRQTPPRDVTDREDIEKAVGSPEDILGPIPSHTELRAELKQLELDMGKEVKESEAVGETGRGKLVD